MSLPEFPKIEPPITREDSINQIIASIAMEELALSHIINAEGEKLQYIIGTIPGAAGLSPTIEQVLEVNDSVRSILESTAQAQAVLRMKLQNALSAATMQGPPGAQGKPGVVEAVGFQAEMLNGAHEIHPDNPIIFNLITQENPDISYDEATGEFTINKTASHSFYLISWWIYADEYEGALPLNITVNKNGLPFHTTDSPYVHTQLAMSVLIPVENEPVKISITNLGLGVIRVPSVGTQAGITILGFKS